MAVSPRATIVVPCHGKASLTARCLEALLEQDLEAEIVVVDDASPDLTPTLLAGYGDRIRTLSLTENAGFATACNLGATLGTSSRLVFLNNDTVPVAGWLDALLLHAERHVRAGIVGAKLVWPSGGVQHAGVAINRDGDPFHLYVGFPEDHLAVSRSRRLQVVTAACMLIDRDLLTRLGGFDPAFSNGFEDVDLCLRAGELGSEVHYCAEAKLWHLESATRGRDLEQDRANLALHRARWAHRVEPDDLRIYQEDELLNFTYEPGHRLLVTVSPLLGRSAERPGTEREDLLTLRSRQHLELVAENVTLRAQVGSTAEEPGRHPPAAMPGRPLRRAD